MASAAASGGKGPFREVEQPLRIGLRFAHPPAQLRQASPDEDHRQLPLRAAVKGGDERRQLRLFDVLQLVDELRQGSACALRGVRGGFQHRREILLEVAVVGETGLRFEIEADLNVGVLDLEALGETRQRAKPALGELLGLFVAAELSNAPRSSGARSAGSDLFSGAARLEPIGTTQFISRR